MPAGVIPFLDLQSGIRVEATGKYLAGCASCRWFPEFYFDPEIAAKDAAYHNQLRHDGAAVEDQPEFHPLSVLTNATKRLRNRERQAMLWAVGYVPFIGLLAVFVGFPWVMALPTVGWGLILVIFGRQWGQQAERVAFAKAQRDAFAAAVDQINHELG